jgi:hypothetical protein
MKENMGKRVQTKYSRGISEKFAEAFRESPLFRLYCEHRDELFIGVRNGYLNVYYKCSSIAKVEYASGEAGIKCWINSSYLGDNLAGGGKGKMVRIEPYEIYSRYEDFKRRVTTRASDEKKAQSELVLLNNTNKDSNWFCVDVEYVKQYEPMVDDIAYNARFDIIAISKARPHRVALIELKYGKVALGGKSGVVKHVGDFKMFKDKGFFEGHLRREIIDIIESQIALGIGVPFELPSEGDLLVPEFFFITLNNNAEVENGSTPKQTMSGYLFNDKRWDCKKISTKDRAETLYGDVTNKDNAFTATFLFSEQKNGQITIDNIIDGKYNEKMLPS